MNKRIIYTVLVAFIAVAVFSSGVLAPSRRTEAFGDPIGNYNFRVEIEGVEAGQFASVDGLTMEVEVIEYTTGDDTLVRKRPGLVSYKNVVFKKGYTATTILSDWINAVRAGDYTRKSVSIVLNDNAGGEIKRWNLFQAFPVRWTVADLDSQDHKALYEVIEIAIEYFEEA